MASEKKIEANRKNALNSTGPKSDEGKKAISLNAVKHGIVSDAILVEGESTEAFHNLWTSFMNSFEPVGEYEFNLVERIVLYTWRLRRVFKLEARLLEESLDSMGVFIEKKAKSAVEFSAKHSTFSTLSRYETSIERMLTRTFHELQRLQAMRNGQTNLVPHAIDIAISE